MGLKIAVEVNDPASGEFTVAEIVRILRYVTDAIEAGHFSDDIRDEHGGIVGSYNFLGER